MRPRIPSLAEHLDGRDRGEAFEEFVAEWARANAKLDDPRQQAVFRLFKTFNIAIVEALRGELAAGRDAGESIELAAGVLGYSMYTAMLGAAREGAAAGKLAQLLIGLIALGVRRAVADQSNGIPP
jgi:hypothetical protein